jgi:hypothetical protein
MHMKNLFIEATNEMAKDEGIQLEVGNFIRETLVDLNTNYQSVFLTTEISLLMSAITPGALGYDAIRMALTYMYAGIIIGRRQALAEFTPSVEELDKLMGKGEDG